MHERDLNHMLGLNLLLKKAQLLKTFTEQPKVYDCWVFVVKLDIFLFTKTNCKI